MEVQMIVTNRLSCAKKKEFNDVNGVNTFMNLKKSTGFEGLSFPPSRFQTWTVLQEYIR